MGSLALDVDVDLVLARCLVAHEPRMAMRVEREAHIRMQQAAVKMLRTVNAVLLRDREDDLQRAVRDGAFAQLPQRFKNGRDAGLVVGTKDSRAIGADDAVLPDGMNVRAGLHAVHMSRQHDGRPVLLPLCRREIRNEIAAVAAQGLAGLILMDGTAELLQALCQEVADFTLIVRRAADADEFEKLSQHALFINHFFVFHLSNLLLAVYTYVL